MRAPAFWSEDSFISRLLSPIGCAYGYAAAARSRRAKPARVNRPVICIGNLVAGGAGKTPVALAVAERLSTCGLKPHFLTRGYGGRIVGPHRVEPDQHRAADVGDEALLLAQRATTWISQDRAAGAQAAERDGADIIVMDDGLQNHGLVKDLSLVVIDGAYGIGNGRVMPAGPLREFRQDGLARADGIVVLGAVSGKTAAILPDSVPVFEASLVPTRDFGKDGAAVVAFAGIGRPSKFFDTLSASGAQVIENRSFPDHHLYAKSEIAALKSLAARHGATLVTTEKDFIRLDPNAAAGIEAFPVSVQWRNLERFDDFLTEAFSNG